MNGPRVFISYSHKDKLWKDRLASHLGDLQEKKLIDAWDDLRVPVGSDFRREIDRAIDRAGVAVLLISANFLASDFILREELPRLLERRGRIVPVIVEPCAWKEVDWLSQMRVFPEDGRPLSGRSEQEWNQELANAAAVATAILRLREAQVSLRVSLLEMLGSEPFEFLLDPGAASAEEIAELLSGLSMLYQMVAGSALRFSVTDCRVGEMAEVLM